MPAAEIKMLVLSLTGRCNFACRYCYAAGLSEREMQPDVAVKAVKLAAGGSSGFIIQFSGGEPLLNFECIKAVTGYVRRNGLPAVLQLQTNASLLDDEKAKYLYENKIAIGISMDGRPGVNDSLRLTHDGKATSPLILRGIEALKRNKIACGLTCVVTAENVNSLEGMIDFAYFLGNIRRIGFDLLRAQGRGKDLAPPAAGALEESLKKALSRSRHLEKLTGCGLIFSQQEKVCSSYTDFGHCHAMTGNAAFVDGKGDIYACASFTGCPDFLIGNVDSGIDERALAKVKEKIRGSMEFCLGCTDFPSCGGGCFARWQGTETPCLSECALKRVFRGQNL